MTETPLWLVTPETPLHLDTVERLARELYDAEADLPGIPRVPWEELREDERHDLLRQVRTVLAVVGRRIPGVLALLPDADSASPASSRRPGPDVEHDPLPRTGT